MALFSCSLAGIHTFIKATLIHNIIGKSHKLKSIRICLIAINVFVGGDAGPRASAHAITQTTTISDFVKATSMTIRVSFVG